MTRHRATLLLLLLLAALPLAACDGGDEVATIEARPSMAVTTATATAVDLAEQLDAGGLVAADTTAMVSSRVVAPILELRARAGQRVRAGEVLIVLDARDLAAHARQARAAVAAAEQALAASHAEGTGADADLTLATAWQGRIAALHERQAATTQELDDANARLAGAAARLQGVRARTEQASSGVTAARAGADAAATTESFSRITAPFDGLVTETFADPGTLAAPGMPLLRLDGAGTPRVEVRIDEARAPHLQVGDRVEVVLDGAVEGTVTEIARAVSADARAFTVKIALPRGTEARTGRFARVRFRGAVRQALVVPATAIRRQGQVAAVFVVENEVARLRLLQTGSTGAEGVEVLAGLDAGEVVVTNPPPALADGQPITGGAR